MKATFRFGIHPRGNKERTKELAFENFQAGEKVYIPISQHIGAPCTPMVEKGDYVKVGTLIASANGFVSANIFSSVSGIVEGSEFRENVFGLKVRHIVIQNDGKYDEEFLEPLKNPNAKDIVNRIKEAGIVGMGGATFPTHVKLSPRNPIKYLIINGVECEPYITADNRLMLEKTKEIVEGIRLIKKAINAEEVYIGIEDNKPKALKAFEEFLGEDIKLFPLKTKYPQGGEKQLIYAITKLEVPLGGLPSDVGCVVGNVATSYAVYEAVTLGKPLYGRYMTVSGEGIKSPKNIYVRTGIPFKEIVEKFDTGDYVKIVSGGPMMGLSQANLNAVTTKGTSSLLLLSKNEIRETEPSACINCGRCQQACPMNLMPMFIDSYVHKRNLDMVEKYSVNACIECGCCGYVCPAKRPLVQSMKLGKKLLKERKK